MVSFFTFRSYFLYFSTDTAGTRGRGQMCHVFWAGNTHSRCLLKTHETRATIYVVGTMFDLACSVFAQGQHAGSTATKYVLCRVRKVVGLTHTVPREQQEITAGNVVSCFSHMRRCSQVVPLGWAHESTEGVMQDKNQSRQQDQSTAGCQP